MVRITRVIFKKGQSLTEVVLLIGVISLALIGMEVYFKRGISGKIKDLADNWIGRQHKAYQQDTSGLETNLSESTYISNSNANLTEKTGGPKTLQSNENATIIYTSTTADSFTVE